MPNTHRTRGSIKFRLKESTKEEKPIFLDFSYGRGRRLKYAIGHSVNPNYWDKRKLRVKNVVAVRNSNDINDLMRDLESELLNFVSECDSKQIMITNTILRDHLNKFTHKGVIEETSTKFTLLVFIDHFIKQKEKELIGGKKNQTVKSYKQTLKHLKEFKNDVGYELDFDTIDSEFYTEFVDYMNHKEYKTGVCYSLNTIGKHIKSFKTFMNGAADAELHTNYKFKKFKPLVEQTTAIYLTLEELEELLNLDLLDEKHLELARDIFIIGCEIGQRISDYHDLKKHPIVTHEGERYIKIKQKKTQKEVLCKITPAIDKIIKERYDGKLPPKITEQKLNTYIKLVGEKAEIDEQIKDERTQGGQKVVTYIPKHKLIMGHSARRTFCTLKYKAGMPVYDIMQLSGHTTEKEFMKYIRNPKEERVAQITNTEAFKNSSIKV